MAALTVRPIRGERGNALIEMTLTLPLLLLIIMGVFDFGLAFQRYEVVTNAAREGARVGVLPGYSTVDAENRALQYLRVGSIGGPRVACNALVPGALCVTAAFSTVTIAGSSPAKSVNQVTVTVQYLHQYSFLGPVMGLFGSSLGQVVLTSSSTMRVEGT